jgi:outer membrane protein
MVFSSKEQQYMWHQGLRLILVSIVSAALLPLTALGPVTAAPNGGPMTLKESLELALRQNLAVHASAEGIREADSRKKEAFTGFLPKLNTYYSYTYLNTPPHIKGLPPPLPPGELTTGTRDNYNWALEARQPVFAGGGILANYQINRIESDIARLDRVTTIQNVLQDVTVAYFNILKAQRIREVALQSLEQLKAHRDIAQNFFTVGLIPKNDLLTSEVQTANGQQMLLRAENDLELARSRFNTLLRRSVDAPVEVEDILEYKPFHRDLVDCQKTAEAGRSDIKAYALKVNQTGKQVDLARSEYFPTVSLVGNYSKFGEGPDLAGSRYQDQENWYVLAVANWTFWEWGRTGHRVDAGLSRKSQVSDALQSIQDRSALEVKSSYLDLKEAEKRISVARQAVEQAEENFRITEERYQEHVATSIDVIDAQTLLTRAKSDHTNALSDYNIAYARLERAMGIIGEEYIK